MADIDGPPSPKKRRCEQSIDTLETLLSVKVERSETKHSIEVLTGPSPKFSLSRKGAIASLSYSEYSRVPLLLTDIQHLLLHSLLGNQNLAIPPRWYIISKIKCIQQTTCLILEGVSIHHWIKYSNEFDNAKKNLSHCVEIITPSVYNGSLIPELALVPLCEVEKEIIIQKYGSFNLALEEKRDLMAMIKAIFPIENEVQENIENPSADKFSRTQLVCPAWQMLDEQYPMPLKRKLINTRSDYVLTKDKYKPVTAESPLFGLDCEMCETIAGSELTRVTVVNEKHEVVYETLVKPYNDIKNYYTKYSGITKAILENVTKRLAEVQNDLKEILPADAILIGQSLNADLHALKMMHPYVIDTSLIFNFTGVRCSKSKLKTFAYEFLHQHIQADKKGHCSKEDSITALKLVQLKLRESTVYGDAVHTKRENYKKMVTKMMTTGGNSLSFFDRRTEKKETSIVVGCDNVTGEYCTYFSQAKETSPAQHIKLIPREVTLKTVNNNEEVISTLSEDVNDFNFNMAHLKLDLSEDDEEEKVKTIDKWIKTIWESIPIASLYVVVFGGTVNDNGIALIDTKME